MTRITRYSDLGNLEEVAANDVSSIHLEQMDIGNWSLTLEHYDGETTIVSLFTKRSHAVSIYGDSDMPDDDGTPIPAKPLDWTQVSGSIITARALGMTYAISGTPLYLRATHMGVVLYEGPDATAAKQACEDHWQAAFAAMMGGLT